MALALLWCAEAAGAQQVQWRRLEPGLELAEIQHESGATGMVVARIDPDRFQMVLLSAKELGQAPRDMEGWTKEFDLAAAINAGMYLGDQRTSTGYMKSPGAVNNPGINPRYGAFFVFGPQAPGLPEVQIVDRYHHDWRELIGQYETVIQNFRMIGAKGENTWRPKPQTHAIACVGTDADGRVLFVHSRR
ncbi:MAG: phosphodiester glycosidase family protein, partial [Desulfovibrionaceae bacterium]